MSDIADWIWLVVAAFWILGRLLPRLFRNRTAEVSAPAERPANEARELPIEMNDDGLPRSIEPR